MCLLKLTVWSKDTRPDLLHCQHYPPPPPPPLPALFYIPSASFHLHHLFLFTAAPPTFLMDFSDPPHLKMFLLCLPASKIWPASDGCLKICHCCPVSLIKTNEIGRHLGRYCRMTVLMYSIMLWWSGGVGVGGAGEGSNIQQIYGLISRKSTGIYSKCICCAPMTDTLLLLGPQTVMD